jgi:hypothetical protein
MKKFSLKKFFPNCENSPGCSKKLIPAVGTNSAKVEGVGKLKKVKFKSYFEFSAISPIRKLINTPNNAILKKSVPDYHTSLSANQSYPLCLCQPITNQDGARDWKEEGIREGGSASIIISSQLIVGLKRVLREDILSHPCKALNCIINTDGDIKKNRCRIIFLDTLYNNEPFLHLDMNTNVYTPPKSL